MRSFVSPSTYNYYKSCMHKYVHTYIHTYIQTYTHSHKKTKTHAYNCIDIYMLLFVCFSFVRSYLFIYLFIYPFIHSFIHSNIHTYIHTCIHSFFHSIIMSMIPFVSAPRYKAKSARQPRQAPRTTTEGRVCVTAAIDLHWRIQI